ncbi:MAG: ABC transporter permease [Terriglobales bacterium]
METLLHDISYGFRMLRKSPGFTAVAIITLALGIGANTALFSVVNGVLLNPLPYPEPARLISVYFKTTQFQQSSVPYLNFLDWQKDNHTFESMAAMRPDDFNLTGADGSERLHGHMISAGLFSLLGLNPLAGREFRKDEDLVGASPVVLLGDGLWKRKFAASANVTGKTLVIDGKAYTVVGVVPGRSSFMSTSDIFIPIGQWNDPTFRDRRIGMSTSVIGRLKPGVSLEQARADMDAVSRNLAAAYPEANAATGTNLIPLKQDIVGDVQPFLLVLLGAVGFVFLIACANVANLLLARATGRTREFAIRVAVGASRSRVIRQLLTESVVLALAGGTLGVAMAWWGTQAVLAAVPSAIPRMDEISVDARVLLFTLGISLLAGIVFGLAPALRTLGPDLQGTLKEGGRGSSGSHHRVQNVFVVFETALALVLLVGAGLMLRTMAALWGDNPGFNPHNVLSFSAALSPSKTATAPLMRASYNELLRRYIELPGVESAALLAGSLPMKGDSELPFWREGEARPASDNQMSWSLFYAVSPDYSKTMKIRLLRGRFLTPEDNEKTVKVIAVDEEFARKFFPNQNPIGKRINLGLFETQPEIVGVVGHVNHWGLGATGHDNMKAELYLPLGQVPDQFAPLIAKGLTVVLRSRNAPESLTAPLRTATAQFDGQAVTYDFETMERIVSSSIATQRFSMTLLGIFAALALVLSAIGSYGVISYFVGQRAQEVGIRMALGAQRSNVLWLILGQGTRMAAVGVAIGVVASLVLTRLMSSMLYGVRAYDPLTFAGVASLVIAVAVLACYVPAMRATRVDPVTALRCE